MSQAPGHDQELPPRPRMNPQQLETWVDQAIQQAQRQGAFDDLPGTGKSLTGLDRPHDPDWWVKGLIEREKLDMTAALPGVMALRRERQAMAQTLAGIPDEAAARDYLEGYNQRVLADRRKPWVGAGSPMVAGRVDVAEMMTVWRTERAALVEAAPQQRPEEHDEIGTAPDRARRRWLRRRGASRG